MRAKLKKEFKGHHRLVLLAGVMLGLAVIYMITNPHKADAPAKSSSPSTATSTPEPKPEPYKFPNGKQTLLPDHRLIALYGNPRTKALGSLGEQPLDQAIARIKALAAEYQKFSEEPIYPAFEIITTVASAGAGEDGDYSAESSTELIKPWVDAAKESGVYVLLDLQPGRSDFLSQAKRYESLLIEPHVGLALDPEWRLQKPSDRHLVRVGSVSAAEINSTATWLADLTKKHDLPQKMLLLHQFKLSMISERDTLDTSRPELAWLIQMDGLGNQNVKQDTWRNIQKGAPANIHFGWKNFYDEDSPMLTPEQTFSQVIPKPYFVSYQ